MLLISLFNFTGDKNKVQKLVQMAWTFVNDRLDCNSFIHLFISINGTVFSFFLCVCFRKYIFFCPHDSVIIQLLPYKHISVIIVN